MMWACHVPARESGALRVPVRASGLVLLLCAFVGLLSPGAFGLQVGRLPDDRDWSWVRVSGTRVNVATGERLVALIDTECSHCQASVPQLNACADAKDFPPFVALCPNEEWRRRFFIQRFKARFELGGISRDDFSRLLGDGDTPRLVLLRRGKVLAVWNGTVPGPGDVRRALARARHP